MTMEGSLLQFQITDLLTPGFIKAFGQLMMSQDTCGILTNNQSKKYFLIMALVLLSQPHYYSIHIMFPCFQKNIRNQLSEFLIQLSWAQLLTLLLFSQKNTLQTFLCLRNLTQISKPFFYYRIFDFSCTKNLAIALTHQRAVFSTDF